VPVEPESEIFSFFLFFVITRHSVTTRYLWCTCKRYAQPPIVRDKGSANRVYSRCSSWPAPGSLQDRQTAKWSQRMSKLYRNNIALIRERLLSSISFHGTTIRHEQFLAWANLAHGFHYCFHTFQWIYRQPFSCFFDGELIRWPIAHHMQLFRLAMACRQRVHPICRPPHVLTPWWPFVVDALYSLVENVRAFRPSEVVGQLQ
jgi:hypothetical protein